MRKRARATEGVRAAALCALALVGCAGSRAEPRAPVSSRRAPDGEAILQRACTVCHDLAGLTAYAEYWGEPEWRSMVETMIAYGAPITPAEVPVLVRFLAIHYGTGANDTTPGGT